MAEVEEARGEVSAMRSRVDIWSLGCIFSEIALWVLAGQRGCGNHIPGADLGVRALERLVQYSNPVGNLSAVVPVNWEAHQPGNISFGGSNASSSLPSYDTRHISSITDRVDLAQDGAFDVDSALAAVESFRNGSLCSRGQPLTVQWSSAEDNTEVDGALSGGDLACDCYSVILPVSHHWPWCEHWPEALEPAPFVPDPDEQTPWNNASEDTPSSAIPFLSTVTTERPSSSEPGQIWQAGIEGNIPQGVLECGGLEWNNELFVSRGTANSLVIYLPVQDAAMGMMLDSSGQYNCGNDTLQYDVLNLPLDMDIDMTGVNAPGCNRSACGTITSPSTNMASCPLQLASSSGPSIPCQSPLLGQGRGKCRATFRTREDLW